MRYHYGYSRGGGHCIAMLGILLVAVAVPAFKALYDLAKPVFYIALAFGVFIGGCLLLAAIAKRVAKIADRHLEKADPLKHRMMKQNEDLIARMAANPDLDLDAELDRLDAELELKP